MENSEIQKPTENTEQKPVEKNENTELNLKITEDIKPAVKVEEPKKVKKPRKPLSEESKKIRAETLKKARESKKQISLMVKQELQKEEEKKPKTLKDQVKENIKMKMKTPKEEKPVKTKKPFQQKLLENQDVITNILDSKITNYLYAKPSLRNFF